MSQDSPRKPRKPLLVNLAWATALIVVLDVVYVLSYAPVYRLTYGKTPRTDPLTSFTRSDNFNDLLIYQPVQLLIDCPLLQEPLLSWAGLFGVRRDFERGKNERELNRYLRETGQVP